MVEIEVQVEEYATSPATLEMEIPLGETSADGGFVLAPVDDEVPMIPCTGVHW